MPLPSRPSKNPRSETTAPALVVAQPVEDTGPAGGHGSGGRAVRIKEPEVVVSVKFVRTEPGGRVQFTKSRALDILAALAETAPKVRDRIAALRLGGLWSGWEDGSEPSGSRIDDTAILASIHALTHGKSDPTRG